MSGCLTEDVCDGVAEVDVVVDDCGVDDDADIADAETGADGAGLLGLIKAAFTTVTILIRISFQIRVE